VSAPAVAADRRFRRVHVKPARLKRARNWWRDLARAAAVLLVSYAALRTAAAAANARALRIDRIVVRGNERLSRGAVLAVLDGLRGQSLVRADLVAWRRRLLADPWVRDAELRRSLPSTIEVAVVERRPAGIARIGAQLYLVDDGGAVIDDYGPQYADFDSPIVDGLPPPGAAGVTDPVRMELAARAIASLSADADLVRRVSQIDVRDAHDVVVTLSGDPVAIRLGDQDFLRRLQSYLELGAALRERVPLIDYADMRFGSRIYVKPAGDARPASRTPSGVPGRGVRPADDRGRRR